MDAPLSFVGQPRRSIHFGLLKHQVRSVVTLPAANRFTLPQHGVKSAEAVGFLQITAKMEHFVIQLILRSRQANGTDRTAGQQLTRNDTQRDNDFTNYLHREPVQLSNCVIDLLERVPICCWAPSLRSRLRPLCRRAGHKGHLIKRKH
jgi:hypothetical protein